MDPERTRLEAQKTKDEKWNRWGPYLSERQWGTVREDYSADGNAWDYFSHDQARSRAYRWGEDGIGGLCDDHQRLCFSVALWNGRDPILKERMFGLTGSEGSHGEDVKELYYYLDATPTHSYLRMLYKYPQEEFPYADLLQKNRGRPKHEMEYELLDTGIFDEDRYFDVFIEFAKASTTDVLIRITAENRGPDAAELTLLPQLTYRNLWSWGDECRKPVMKAADGSVICEHEVCGCPQIRGTADDIQKLPPLGTYHFYADGQVDWLFTENNSNAPKLWGQDAPGPFKDAFHEAVVNDNRDALANDPTGTKVGARRTETVEAGGRAVFKLRLVQDGTANPFADFDAVFDARKQEADAFYAELQGGLDDDVKLVQRQALAGMIWTKQYYYYDIPQWLHGDKGQPAPPPSRKNIRNADWEHVNNADVLSMPDKWEYPWFAAWDLAFHTIPLAMVDPEFAKGQLTLMIREWYMHPNGQIPAYEWNFSDVNPPVHAWATWRVFELDRERRGDEGDLEFLESVFHKLMLNFTWWVNRKDIQGLNIFQGGFLGLDNIGVFDRSAPLPEGGHLNQADGTSWMAMYSLNLMRIAIELAEHNPVYENVATKFFEHFLHIAEAMTNMGGDEIGLWDEEDKFYYDELHLESGENIPLKVRSMVGLIPLFAVEVLNPETMEKLEGFSGRLQWFLDYREDLAKLVSHWEVPGKGKQRLLSLLRGHRMKALLRRALDESEFLSDHGVRALSKYHEEHPYVFHCQSSPQTVDYQPGESQSWLFGGNSNWRGPVWMPVNYLLIESIRRFYDYYGDDFQVEYPTGSGKTLSLAEIADELSRRLLRLFTLDSEGKRPVFNHSAKMQEDPNFRDHILFYEYFHGDNGRGVGASHQTGWTGLIAKLIDDLPR